MKRVLLYFLIGCVGARLLLVIIAKKAPILWLKWLGVLALLPSFGFLYLFLSGTREKNGAFGEKIWWGSLRPIHAFLYFLFALFAINGNKNAWIFLLVDLCIGVFSFFYVHIKQGDFRSLL